MTIEEVKKNLEKLQTCYDNFDDKRCSYAKKVKELIKQNEFLLWKLEAPESFENHKKALEQFINGTHL